MVTTQRRMKVVAEASSRRQPVSCTIAAGRTARPPAPYSGRGYRAENVLDLWTSLLRRFLRNQLERSAQ